MIVRLPVGFMVALLVNVPSVLILAMTTQPVILLGGQLIHLQFQATPMIVAAGFANSGTINITNIFNITCRQ